MSAISRREFMQHAGIGAAGAGLVAAGVVTLEASPFGWPIGSQTYPHRQFISEGRFPELLKTLAGLGVQRIELCSAIGYKEFANLADGKQTKRMIADAGLKCESAHFSMRELRESQEKSLAWAKEIGITQIITASLGGGNTPTMDDVKKAADEYNKIAAVSQKAGCQQGLHNEGFELSEVEGKRTYDILMGLLDPKLVKFQFQMSTISQGFVAAEYFMKYPGRFFSMHVQDVDLNATPPPPPEPAPGAPPRPNRPRGRGVQTSVGKGSIDWVKTFQAAKAAGVKNYFVEQNMDLTKDSVAYLKTLKV
jgi:sugar phosphate isomerase/epimerase